MAASLRNGEEEERFKEKSFCAERECHPYAY
jgi:hypothetical protein